MPTVRALVGIAHPTETKAKLKVLGDVGKDNNHPYN